MRWPHLVVLTVLSIVMSGALLAAAAPGGVAPAAPSVAAGIAVNASVAGRADSLAITGWLNLTGSGSLQLAWVNFTLEADLVPDDVNATAPRQCTRQASGSWECNGLRSGSFVFSVPASVNATAALGPANATINATTFSSGTYTTTPGRVVSVEVVGADVTSFVTPTSASAYPGQQVILTIEVINGPNATGSAWNVSVTIVSDPLLLIDPDTNLTMFVAELTSGSARGLQFQAIVSPNATGGTVLQVRIVTTYEDFDYRPVGPREVLVPISVLPSELVPTAGYLGAIGALAIPLLVILALFLVGQRRIRIDEVFLMHRSGILIQHQSRGPALKKDDDLVASMLVAIQEFVRDSFRSEATLDEFAFGGRHAAIVRGKDVVLAAILSRGDVRYLLSQLEAAVKDIEEAHGSLLANWDGRIGRLDRAGPVITTLLAGGYRVRAWTNWARGARMRIPRVR